MAATWDEQAYASGASAGAAAENDDSEFGELDPKSVTSTLKDSFFPQIFDFGSRCGHDPRNYDWAVGGSVSLPRSASSSYERAHVCEIN